MTYKESQRGAVLILLFVGLIVAAATVFLGALNSQSPQLRDRANKQREMQHIKEILLSYALFNPEYNTAPNGPGRLPCSDTDNDGQMNCNTNTVGLGRLPQWVDPPAGGRVFLSDLYAPLSEQFWYAVAPAFRQNSNTLNTNSTTTFTLDGSGSIAAVIIAPGPSLDGQVRVNNNQAARYLESTNATGPGFVSAHPTTPALLNDMVEPITVAELFSYATTRVAQEIRRVIDNYYTANGNTYPIDTSAFTATMAANGATWVSANAWITSSLSAYTFVNADRATVQFSNCSIAFTFDRSISGFTRSQSRC